MHGYEIIEVTSVNKNRDAKDWYNSNVKYLAQILGNKLNPESASKVEPDDPISNYKIDNSGKAVSK